MTWGWLGVAIQSITPSIAKGLGLNQEQSTGALVASVMPDSPAATAGLESGDVITAAGGHQIKTVRDLPRLVAAATVGSRLSLTILRNGKEQTVEATIGEMPQKVASAQQSEQPTVALGMELVPLTAQLRTQLQVPKDVNGVVIDRISGDSPARALGLQTGDVVVSIDQRLVTSPVEAAGRLKEVANQGNVLLLVNRRGTNEFVGLSIENNGTAGSSSP